MIVDIARLAPEGEEYEGDEPAEILELQDDEYCRAGQPVHYRLFVQIVSHELIVNGSISTTVDFYCSRCSARFPVKIQETSFYRAYELEGETIPRLKEHPESVDLTADIREATILNFPAYPVCRDECRGLCSMCGKNLNEGMCDCRPPADLRWDALDNIRLD